AFGMLDAIQREGEITSPDGQVFELGLKVAIAVGDARRFVVGDPEIQLIDGLAGRLVDRIAAAEQLAGSGEVVVDADSLAALADRIAIDELRDGDDGTRVAVVGGVRDDVPELRHDHSAVVLDGEVTRPWLLPAVYERLSTGRGEFLAELRPA